MAADLNINSQIYRQFAMQQIHAAYRPKGQAVADLEIFQRIAAALAGEEALARA